MGILLTLPILIPLGTAVATLLAWNQRQVQRLMSLCGAIGLFGAGTVLLATVQQSGIVAIQIGNWPAPFGITLVADLFSALMVFLAGVTGLAVAGYGLASTDAEHEAFGYHPLYHVLLLGVCGSFLTGDLFNLYVWFEVMLIASFVLLALGGRREQMEGALKYVSLNLISSALFLSALGILYGVAGTLNMADLALVLRTSPHTGIMTVLAVLFLVSFGIKSAIFPLFFWLPASYHTPPVTVSAIFAALLTKVGVYVLVRIFTLLFIQDQDYSHALILVTAGLTMVAGALGAVVQKEFRRLLSFHIVSQIGYLLMGLGLLTPLALAAMVLFMMNAILAKAALFLVGGLVHRTCGTWHLSRLGGLYRNRPGISFLFLIPALSLAGLPPLAGFWPKLMLVRAALEAGQPAMMATALGVSLLTLYYLVNVWAELFWKSAPDHPAAGDVRRFVPPAFGSWSLMILSTAGLVALVIFMAVAAEPCVSFAMDTARQLLNPAGYIFAVLGRTP